MSGVISKAGSVQPRPFVRRRPAPSCRPSVAIAFTIVLVACGDSGTTEPNPTSVAFRTQPSEAVAGAYIAPPVEVRVVADGEETVEIELAENDCGAVLGGQTSRLTANGTATFADLAVDIPANGFKLRAGARDRTAVSAAFAVAPAPTSGPLVQQASVCLRGSPQSDAASLTWVATDDVLWTADDNRNQLIGVDRRSGALINTVPAADLEEAFSLDCDDGDGNPATSCSYTGELEVVAYDSQNRFLYAFNTVNDPTLPVPVDRPAAFRLRSGGCRGCLTFEDWNALDAQYAYQAVVVIEGQLYIADGPELHGYDFTTNIVAAEPALGPINGVIAGLAYRDGRLYLAMKSRRLQVWNWGQRELLESYDLAPLGVGTVAGVEVVRDTVYVLEGQGGNPIFVATIVSNED